MGSKNNYETSKKFPLNKLGHNKLPAGTTVTHSCTAPATICIIQYSSAVTILCSRVLEIKTCRAAQEAGAPHHEYINKNK